MAEETNILEYLKTFSYSDSVYFYPNPGNAGDALIASATLQVFSDLKINYRIINPQKFDPRNKILFFGGGGGLIHNYEHAKSIIEKFHHRVKKLVILPHTICNHEDLLMSFGDNIDIFCRERVSYEHVKRNAPKAHVMLSDDLAFYLDVERILSKEGSTPLEAVIFELEYMLRSRNGYQAHYPTIKQLARFLKREIKLFKLLKNNNSKILNCFRKDNETTGRALPEDNIDLSKLLYYGTEKDNIIFWSVNQLLRFINHYDTIRTDRLHLAIAGVLLDKNVELFKNNYYKNEAVYKYSIENKFPKVRFIS